MFTFKKIELKEEIGRYIKQEQLHTALKEESTQQRLGLIAQVIQDAARDSSLTTFSGRTYFFNGRVYEPIETNAFSDFIYDLMREIGSAIFENSIARIEEEINGLNTKRDAELEAADASIQDEEKKKAD